MCGICGIVDFSDEPREAWAQEMTLRLHHRGPDMGGIETFESCVLGHRRLSILDLSETAKQPMLSEDGRVGLVFNGEIYNYPDIKKRLEAKGHRFRTTSDTEVVLRLYLEMGDDMLAELNGMFSLAIWDSRKARLMLARDRLGKKPLYYWRRRGRLSFSSELYSLMADRKAPAQMKPQAIAEFFLYDFIPAPHTIFEGIFKLPAGHKASFDGQELSIERYWETPRPEAGFDYQERTTELLDLIEDAVRIRLISDVPLGAFLSGGIDSTLIAALMRRNVEKKVKTFSIAFPGASHDESSWSRLASRALDTDHREYTVDYQLERIFPHIVRHFGEPFGDSSAIPTWRLAEHTRRHVTVSLSGDGGDELFGGYERYLARRVQMLYDRAPAVIRKAVIEPLVEHLPDTTAYYGTSLAKKLKLFVKACQRTRENPLYLVPRTYSSREVAELTGIEYDPDVDPAIEAARQWVGLDAVSQMLITDIHTYLAEDILTKVDRMSMAHSLEVRAPLLDYRVVEFACRTPLGFKLRGLKQKRILKDAAHSIIPEAIVNRSKYGFQVPLGDWFKNSLKSWASERLFDSGADLFRRGFVEKLWLDHVTGRVDNAHKIWLLLAFNEWREQLGSELKNRSVK